MVAVEAYTGLLDEVERELRERLGADLFASTTETFRSPAEIDTLVAPFLGGDDPLWGLYSDLELASFLDPPRRAALRSDGDEPQSQRRF